MLSEAFVDYVRDLRQPADVGIIYVDRELSLPRRRRAILLAGAASGAVARRLCRRNAAG